MEWERESLGLKHWWSGSKGTQVVGFDVQMGRGTGRDVGEEDDTDGKLAAG